MKGALTARSQASAAPSFPAAFLEHQRKFRAACCCLGGGSGAGGPQADRLLRASLMKTKVAGAPPLAPARTPVSFQLKHEQRGPAEQKSFPVKQSPGSPNLCSPRNRTQALGGSLRTPGPSVGGPGCSRALTGSFVTLGHSSPSLGLRLPHAQ